MESKYQKLYNRHADFFRRSKRRTNAILYSGRICTQIFALSYLAFGAWLLIKRQTRTLILLGVALFACLVCIQILRFFFPRKRPFACGITPLIEKQSTGKSFPSRHTACAFTIATIAIKICGWFCIPLYVAGLWLAYTRFVLGWHYPSDLLGGAVIGGACGLIMFI